MYSYKLFTTPTCPNCPSVKAYLKNVELPGEFVDASSREGFELAKNLKINTVPTVVFFKGNDEVSRVFSRVETESAVAKMLSEMQNK